MNIRSSAFRSSTWFLCILGEMARRSYYHLKRKTAAVKIQKSMRGKLARKKYKEINIFVIVLQTGFRAMAARNELRNRKGASASLKFQVCAVLVMLNMHLFYLFIYIFFSFNLVRK